MKSLYKYILDEWDTVKDNPTSEEVFRRVAQYANSLMLMRKFYNPEVARNIADEVLSIAAERLFPDWESVGPATYSAFLYRTVRNKVMEYFTKYARMKKNQDFYKGQ
jgi:hypothetical protein